MLDQKELEDDDLFDALRMEIMILKQIKHPCALLPHPSRVGKKRVRARVPAGPREAAVRDVCL